MQLFRVSVQALTTSDDWDCCVKASYTTNDLAKAATNLEAFGAALIPIADDFPFEGIRPMTKEEADEFIEEDE